MHINAAHSDVDTAAKIIRLVYLYKILALFLDTNVSSVVAHGKTCVNLVFRLRIVAADASMIINN